jgi:hypothetical protein
MKPISATILSLFLCWTPAASAQESWHRQFTTDRTVSVEFPQRPLATNKPDQEVYIVLGDDGAVSLAFVLEVYTLPDGVSPSKAKMFLESELTETETTKYGTRSRKTINGLDVIEAIGLRDGRDHLRSQGLLKGRQLIMLHYSGPSESLRGPAAARFFSSLQIKK